MQVPVLWTPLQNPSKGIPIVLRREWATSGLVEVMDRTGFDPKDGSWTIDGARHFQGMVLTEMAKDPHLSNPRALELSDGRFTSVCEEVTMGRDAQSLICYVVGTPLQFSYLGSGSYEPVARKMLASLN